MGSEMRLVDSGIGCHSITISTMHTNHGDREVKDNLNLQLRGRLFAFFFVES